MTAHDPRVTLTEAERALLDDKCPSNDETDGWEYALLHRTVESILAARLAPIWALAAEWHHDGGSCAPSWCRICQLRAALEATGADPRASQDHAWHKPLTHCHCGRVIPCRHDDGAEGQDEGSWPVPCCHGPVHNHPPYEPTCNERRVDGLLRGACLNDDGSPR